MRYRIPTLLALVAGGVLTGLLDVGFLAREGRGLVLRPETSRCDAAEAFTGSIGCARIDSGMHVFGRIICSSRNVCEITTCARCGRELSAWGRSTDEIELYRSDESRFFVGCMKCLEEAVALAEWTRRPDDSGRLINGIEREITVREELRSLSWYRDRWALSWIDSSSRAHQILHEGNR